MLVHLLEGGPPDSTPDPRSKEPGVGSGRYKRKSLPLDTEVEENAKKNIYYLRTTGKWSSAWSEGPTLAAEHYYKDKIETPRTLDEWRALQKKHPEFSVYLSYYNAKRGGVASHRTKLGNLELYGRNTRDKVGKSHPK